MESNVSRHDIPNLVQEFFSNFPPISAWVVTSSSSHGPAIPDKAIDCFINCNGPSRYFMSASETFPWLQLDLGQSTIVRAVHFYIQQGSLADFQSIRVFVTDTAASGTGAILTDPNVCADYPGPPGANEMLVRVVCTSPMTGQYIIVQRVDPAMSDKMRIDEISFLGDRELILTVSYWRVRQTILNLFAAYVFASSRSNVPPALHLPAYAVDGEVSAAEYFRSYPESHPWIVLDFGSSLTILRINVTFVAQFETQDFEIRVGTNSTHERDR